MKRWVNALNQILALTSQMLVPVMPWDDATKNTAHVVIAFWQLVIGILAHAYTPDGEAL